MAKKTEAEVVYERIEELTGSGTRFADAVRTVAEERGKKENAVRANYYNHKKKLDGGTSSSPRSRGRSRATAQPLSVDNALAQAKALLEEALANIDREVETARAEVDTAQARYDELVASVADRKSELETKIAALS